MRLVALLIVAPVEKDRYLLPCVESLVEFCDVVAVWCDGGLPQTRAALRGLPVAVQGAPRSVFMEHEGRARQMAYDWALAAQPTHILAIDADEFVADGQALRAACEHRSVTGLCMQEIWVTNPGFLSVRMDGGWAPHPVPCVFRPRAGWRIPDRAHASGRTPLGVIGEWSARDECATELLHFGWANQGERAERYARYAGAGNFGHSARHIQSIMWPEERVQLCETPWPAGLEPVKTRVLEAANRG